MEKHHPHTPAPRENGDPPTGGGAAPSLRRNPFRGPYGSYAWVLRALGQDFDGKGVTGFELVALDDGFTATMEHPRERSFFGRLLSGGRAATRTSVARYTLEDGRRLDAMGRVRRGTGGPRPDPAQASELLRLVGADADSCGMVLTRIVREGADVLTEYVDAAGRSSSQRRSAATFGDLSVHMYLKRRAVRERFPGAPDQAEGSLIKALGVPQSVVLRVIGQDVEALGGVRFTIEGPERAEGGYGLTIWGAGAPHGPKPAIIRYTEEEIRSLDAYRAALRIPGLQRTPAPGVAELLRGIGRVLEERGARLLTLQGGNAGLVVATSLLPNGDLRAEEFSFEAASEFMEGGIRRRRIA